MQKQLLVAQQQQQRVRAHTYSPHFLATRRQPVLRHPLNALSLSTHPLNISSQSVHLSMHLCNTLVTLNKRSLQDDIQKKIQLQQQQQQMQLQQVTSPPSQHTLVIHPLNAHS